MICGFYIFVSAFIGLTVGLGIGYAKGKRAGWEASK